MSRKPPKPYKNKQHPYLLYKNIHTGKAENRTNNIHNEQIAFTDFSYQKGDKSIAGVAAAPIIVVRVPFKTPCCSVVRPKVSLIP